METLLNTQTVNNLNININANEMTCKQFTLVPPNGLLTNEMGFQTPNGLAASIVYKWPLVAPTAGQSLIATAPVSGVSTLSWGGSTPISTGAVSLALAAPIGPTAAVTTVLSIPYTFPLIGGPFRVVAIWDLVFTYPLGGELNVWIQDATSSATFASTMKTVGSALADAETSTGMNMTQTYAGGSTVTFNMVADPRGNNCTYQTVNDTNTKTNLVIYALPA